MNDGFEELVIDVRATTDGFAADLENMRGTLDSTLIEGFDRVGSVFERSLLSAIRRGSLGFDDLKRVAFSALDSIASHALQSGISSLFGGGGQGGGIAGLIGQSLGSLLGLPGRATGGPVSPGRGYIVGENGPELFLPTSSGQISPNSALSGGGRDVRVAIQLSAPRETSAPTALRRSSRQLASAVRRTLQER